MKKNQLRTMRLHCGDFKWVGDASTVEEAIIIAFSSKTPNAPGLLVCVHDGFVKNYIDFIAALKIAGYNVRKIKDGWRLG